MGTVTGADKKSRSGRHRSRRRLSRRARVVIDRLVITSLFITALAISLYPLGAMYVNDRLAFQAAQEASYTQSQAAADDPAAAQRIFEEAHAYSQGLPETMLEDPIIGQNPNTSAAYQDYLRTLGGDTEPIATLVIPAINSTLPVAHGTSEDVLSKGAGHMFGTHLPVGGHSTHSVLSAHRGLPNLTGFDNLPDLELGDVFFVKVLGQTLAYQVREINTVLPNDLDQIRPVPGKDLITLVTCTPYAINTHRLLVTGERVRTEDVVAEQLAQVDEPVFAWSLPPGATTRLWVAGAAGVLLVVMFGRWLAADLVLPFIARSRKRHGAVPAETARSTT